MLTPEQILELIQSLIWLLAGVGIFIVGMNFMSSALEQSAGEGMKRLLGKICGNRFAGVGIGAGVTAIIQSSSATSVMVIGLVNAGMMTLLQATPVLMGAKIGTTVTGILVALKNDYFDMAMYLLAFAGVMMGFFKKEKVKIAGNLCSGLGIIFVGLNIMSSSEAFGNELVKGMFTNIFAAIDFPLLLVLVGIIFTALIQSSSAATGIVITMVGAGVMELDLALFIVMGANIGTCVTALLASLGGTTNAKRVALIHCTNNTIGAIFFTVVTWIFRDQAVAILSSVFPGNDAMSMQMRVSLFHVIFNVTTTALLLPFVKQLVQFSEIVIRDKTAEKKTRTLRFVDDNLLAMPPIALMQVKKEIEYMLSLAEENTQLSMAALQTGSKENEAQIKENEEIINFTNKSLTGFLIKLSSTQISAQDEANIGASFHVLNDLERIGDHAINFYEIGAEMAGKKLTFSEKALSGIATMSHSVIQMFGVAKDTLVNLELGRLPELAELEEGVDGMKKNLIASHFTRLAEGNCSVDVSPYYSSVIVGLERVADHLINVGYSVVNPTGSQSENA